MDRNYRGLVWTNHALGRMKERGISQSDAWATFDNPELSRVGSGGGTTVYYRTWGNLRIEVVAKKENGNWIIMSVWSKPIFTNSKPKPKNFFESLRDLARMIRK